MKQWGSFGGVETEQLLQPRPPDPNGWEKSTNENGRRQAETDRNG
jgi:hypothetical protein